MSKLIVEMEMPKHGCCDCMVELMGLCVIQDKDVPLYNENGDYPTELPKGCPIKGVLPDEHGDLIDRDKAKDAFDSSFLTFRMKDGETMRGFYQRTIAELPTVIAAERKDDGTLD